MKLSVKQVRKLIKEELKNLNENNGIPGLCPACDHQHDMDDDDTTAAMYVSKGTVANYMRMRPNANPDLLYKCANCDELLLKYPDDTLHDPFPGSPQNADDEYEEIFASTLAGKLRHR